MISIRFRCRRSQKSGFVLITVVILLAVVGLMLAKLATISLGQAREANREHRAMQSHWAVTSLRQVVTKRGELLLETNSSPNQSFAVALSEVQWDVRLADESAKLNLPHLLRERPLIDVRQAADSLMMRTRLASLSRNVASNDQGVMNVPRRYEAWFELRGSGTRADGWMRVGEDLTLWGDGKLNLNRAPADVIDASWRALFGTPAPAVLRELGDYPENRTNENRQEMVEGLNLGESDQAVFDRFFTFGSTATSVWIVPRGEAGRRKAYFFVWWGDGYSGERMGLVY